MKKNIIINNLGILKLFSKGNSKLQIAVTTFFALLITVTSILTLLYTYIHISNASIRSARKMMRITNTSVRKDVARFMRTAWQTSQTTAWTLQDTKYLHGNMEKIFRILSGHLVSKREIFSVQVGDSTGSIIRVSKLFDEPTYYLDRSKLLPPEVVYRSLMVDRLSIPVMEHNTYYDKNFKPIGLEITPPQKVKYDCRKRSWYRDAAETKNPVWTDIRIFGNGEFGASNARPSTDKKGNILMVVSTTIALSLKDGIASSLNFGDNGISFLMNENGDLIAYPDVEKIIRCEKKIPGERMKCEFNKVNQIDNRALSDAYETYLKKSDMTFPENIPVRLNYNDHIRSIKRLKPEEREAFDKAYTINEKNKIIKLNRNLTKTTRASIGDILNSIRYNNIFRFYSGGREYLANFHKMPDRFGKPWMIGSLVPINDFIGILNQTIRKVTMISLGILIISLIIIYFFSKKILRPLEEIANDMNMIKNLDIDESRTHHSFFYEISIIANALASMKHGLKAFSKFVPNTLVKQLIVSGKGAELGGEKRHITIMFTDIEGFTSISETMTTDDLLIHISEYLDNLTKVILSQKGTIDKYIGDAIMCFWGAPITDHQQEYNCCKTALLCKERLSKLNARWALEGKPLLNTRFGISSGEVSVGNMGSSDRMNYTVLGDSVNLASRLESINKYFGTNIIVGEDTYEKVKTMFCFRPVDIVAVKGKEIRVKIYQLLAASSDEPGIAPTQPDLRSRDITTRAFDAYLNRNFHEALELYSELAHEFPHDQLAKIYTERCSNYATTPPPDDWDGVTRMNTK